MGEYSVKTFVKLNEKVEKNVQAVWDLVDKLRECNARLREISNRLNRMVKVEKKGETK